MAHDWRTDLYERIAVWHAQVNVRPDDLPRTPVVLDLDLLAVGDPDRDLLREVTVLCRSHPDVRIVTHPDGPGSVPVPQRMRDPTIALHRAVRRHSRSGAALLVTDGSVWPESLPERGAIAVVSPVRPSPPPALAAATLWVRSGSVR